MKSPQAAVGKSGKSIKWMKAQLTELTGVEFSAYGVSKEDGGLAVTITSMLSDAKKAGFQNGDLIQAVNGRKTANIKQFNQVIKGLKGTVKFKVVRNQQSMEFEIALWFDYQQLVEVSMCWQSFKSVN